MVISSAGYRRLAGRTAATIQAARAQYLTGPEAAAVDAAKTSVRVFAQQAEQAFAATVQTGMIALDASLDGNGDFPATTANLQARYLVIREGQEFEFSAQATCVLFFVIRGSGRSFQEDEVIEWGGGDVFVFAGGESILNEAPDGDAVLFVVTDEPFVSMTGCSVPSREHARCKSTHYKASIIQAKLEDMVDKRDKELQTRPRDPAQDSDSAGAGGDMAASADRQDGTETAQEAEVLVFTSSQFEGIGCITPTVSAGIAMLAGGARTPAHRHDSDTISLCLKSDGVYSMIGTERIDWRRNTVILTPAGAIHSQHNDGESRMFSFFVQDRGPRPIRSW